MGQEPPGGTTPPTQTRRQQTKRMKSDKKNCKCGKWRIKHGRYGTLCCSITVSQLQEGVISHTRLDHKVTCIRAPQEAQMINLRYKILCYCYQKR